MRKLWLFITKLIRIFLPFIVFFAVLLLIVRFINNYLADKILEYLKVIIWPSVILTFIFSFKANIAKFIDEISEFDFFGNKARREQPTLSQKPPQENVPEVIKESTEEKTEEIKRTLTSSLSSEELEKQKDFLLGQVAELQIALRFERIYQIIFGSQIKLLESLMNTGSVGIMYEDIAAYYQNVKANWPNLNSYPLENYLGYLISVGLIILFIDGNQKKYKITVLGIDFLEYINKLNYIKEKSS